MRTIKDAEERRNEILDAAQALFTGKGYNKTTIIDILERVGIAKGTFYYYFKSKEEVMDAIIERMMDKDRTMAQEIALDAGLTPVEKIFNILNAQKPRSGDSKDLLIEQFHSPSNADMHQKSIARAVTVLAPILEDVVRQGVKEHLFKTDYPRETMEFLILSGQNMFDTSMFQLTPEEMHQKIKAFICTMELLLGAEKGSFSCIAGLLGETDGAGAGAADSTAPAKEEYNEE